jgi:hypothetical protein
MIYFLIFQTTILTVQPHKPVYKNVDLLYGYQVLEILNSCSKNSISPPIWNLNLCRQYLKNYKNDLVLLMNFTFFGSRLNFCGSRWKPLIGSHIFYYFRSFFLGSYSLEYRESLLTDTRPIFFNNLQYIFVIFYIWFLSHLSY